MPPENELRVLSIPNPFSSVAASFIPSFEVALLLEPAKTAARMTG
jgi:hypothetical protein